MTDDDIHEIESRLSVSLPESYRQVLDRGVRINGRDPHPYVYQSARELLITNLQLRMSPRENAFCGRNWPPEFICIGDDGCGNYYCISAGGRDTRVRFFDHESDSFEIVSDDLSGFFTQLERLFAEFPENPPHSEATESESEVSDGTREAGIARTDDPRESVLDPIPVEDWTRFVESDPDLQMREYTRRINPFTKAEARLPSPGLAILVTSGGEVEFQYVFGRITVGNPGPEALDKLRRASEALKAKYYAK